MKFLIVTHVLHKKFNNRIYAYAPYIREMHLWEKYIDELIVIAPIINEEPSKIDLPYNTQNIAFIEVPKFNLINLKNLFKTLIIIPDIFFTVCKGLGKTDHVHLRCPGNMGFIGSIAQILFPQKIKTAKYAGNWDWNSKQPWSYRLQQFILRNTFLTRNMQVLVYGDWNETKNIKPFFTASYSENEITETPPRKLDIDKPIQFIFVGGLNEGKRPMLSLEVIKKLKDENVNCEIHFYGEGNERLQMVQYISEHHLKESAFLHGNVDAAVIKKAFQESHFLLFISKSEGWPKVVAESMFWGCLPLTSAVSCVPEMIGNGARGEIIEPDVDVIVEKFQYYLKNPIIYKDKCQQAMDWSREFTLEKFEIEVKNLL